MAQVRIYLQLSMEAGSSFKPKAKDLQFWNLIYNAFGGGQTCPLSETASRLRYSVFFQMLITWVVQTHSNGVIRLTNKTLQSPGWEGHTPNS